MENYEGLTVQVNEKNHEYRLTLSGYATKYCKAMIISDMGLTGLPPKEKKGRKVSAVYPTGSTEEERNNIVTYINTQGFQIIQAVLGACALAEFYTCQNRLHGGGTNIVTVETYGTYTDISFVKCEGTNYRIQDKERILEGSDDPEREATAAYRTAAGINRMRQKHKIHKCKVLLAGDFWNVQKHVEYVKEKLTDVTVYAYKPSHALVLGGCMFLKKHGRKNPAYTFPEHFSSYHCTALPATEYQKLNTRKRNIYCQRLDAIGRKKKEVKYENNNCSPKELMEVHEAMVVDHPEIQILIDYEKHNFWVTEDKKYVTREELIYRKGEKLKEINDKAEQIIETVLGKNDDQITDDQTTTGIYEKIMKDYHYTREPMDKNGFPKYCYTLEGLLSAGVCACYARALVYLLAVKLQIPCQYVTGEVVQQTTGSHAWNVIQQTSGEYRHCDVTFDLEKDEKEYFAMNDIQFRARGHFTNTNENYPACK